jgi:sugar lactone lactonase YvrE
MPSFEVVECADRDLLGEGPLWSARENVLYWVDIKAPHVNRLDLADGAMRTWAMPEAIGWLVERRDASTACSSPRPRWGARTSRRPAPCSRSKPACAACRPASSEDRRR